ncbi:MAG: calcium/sodium antiporter [Bacteroidales bacterium]|nr:calcium/sodium antiporter [Bacteroidales bacterium]
MALQIILFLVGLALVVFGADYLVEGASAVARRFGLSEFVIGLTIVGMGTSAPEMVVSFIGAAQGNADIALGNVVGSNIFNTLLILGITALILPMAITKENRRRDIPMNIVTVVVLILLGLEHTIFGIGSDGLSRLDGGILLALFIGYMWFSFKHSSPDSDSPSETRQLKIWLAILYIAGGLSALVFGGRMFVNSAVSIAQTLGVSDKFIAITIIAGGTSMPELATCVAAAVKKKGQLALGNIIGSNIFNVLLILGGSALINPLSFADISFIDLGILLASALALLTSCHIGKKNSLDRLDGALFLLLWAAYMTWLIVNL